ncbi:hypothetical protein [Sandaracinus amylolyticus]|nr:hypothetical protein [Sandaracinus amylolyticus]
MRARLSSIALAWALASCVCGPGQSLCGDRCVDLASTPTDCGACGRACPTPWTCERGECAPPPGVCRTPCGAGEACVDGVCVCAAGLTDCGNACVDLARDPSSCGACGEPCPAGASCEGGACVCPPSAPDTCDGACVDLTTDVAHCGACGTACPETARCASGACACPGALALACDGACVDGATDPRHCGACGSGCTIECDGGACLSVREVAIGGSHVVVLMSDEVPWTWGYNVYCQLGDGTCSTRGERPERVYPLDRISQITAGQGHTCARVGGEAYCWGWNEDGQLGVGNTEFAYRSALRIFTAGVAEIDAGYRTTCVRGVDGTVWCWGDEQEGLAASPGAGAISTPVQWSTFDDVIDVDVGGEVCVRRASGAVHCSAFGSEGSWPREVPAWHGASQVAVGSEHACAIVAGSVSCTGRNRYGQIGNGAVSSTAWVAPTTVPVGETVVEIALATSTTCARGASGRVYCWGSGYDELTGPFGDRETPTPQPIPSTAGAQRLVCGMSTCCVHFGGTDLRCWGNDYNGELADGMFREDRDTPYPVQW